MSDGAAKPVFTWELGELPFFWRTHPAPSNGEGVPDTLPFSCSLERRTGTLIQIPNPAVSRALESVYSKGSVIAGGMEDSSLGRAYTDDFVAFILSALGRPDLAGLRLLDIGAGSGFFLHRARQLGAGVRGIEPGAHGQDGARRYGVEIAHDFFPSKAVRDCYDLIVIYGVLEHVEDPASFLRAVSERCNPGATVLIAVPNCEPFMQRGDISIFIHEHWNYYTKSSLRSTVELAGGRVSAIQEGTFGGMLFAALRFGPQAGAGLPASPIKCASEEARTFEQRARANCAKLGRYLSAVASRGESMGIYVPGRALNALFATKAPLSNTRFFDDNETLWGTYFAGIDIAIESRQQLIDRPTDHVAIMSLTFGERIKADLGDLLPARTEIVTLGELLTADTR